MKNRKNIKYNILMMVSSFVLLLLIIGISMYGRIHSQLYNYMEKQAENQINAVSETMNMRMELEFKELEQLAQYYETEKDAFIKRLESKSDESEFKIGLLTIDGTTLSGEDLDFGQFKGIYDSFHGNKAVSFSDEKGLLFTMPVYNGKNIRYVIYKLYNKSVLGDNFKSSIYNENGRTSVVTRDGNVVIPVEDGKTDLTQHMRDTLSEDNAKKIKDELNLRSWVAVHSKDAESFFMIAELKYDGMYLIADVPEDILIEDIEYVLILIKWVYGLLMILFVIGILTMFNLEQKAEESDELREEKLQAEQANYAKSSFLARMSHEIRTPINAVLGMDEMILRESSEQNIREYATDIRNAGESLLTLINDILDFSKIESGKLELVETEYSIAEILHTCCQMIRLRADNKNLCFEVDVKQDIPSLLYGDGVRLQQIIVNLLTNAVKYTKEGTIKLCVNCDFIEGKKILLKIDVQDTGIGIRQEDLNKLFNSFERLDEQKNRSIEGTGLGLAITAQFVRLMEGDIDVESEYGKGSVFKVEVPQTIISDKPIGDFWNVGSQEKDFEDGLEDLKSSSGVVLVVDDILMNLKVFTGLLKDTGLTIDTADGGYKCLEMVKNKKYDIIFMDDMMPEINGREVFEKMKQMSDSHNKDTPVIMMTANAISGAKEEYIDLGFSDYLSKPVERGKLIKLLKNYMPTETENIVQDNSKQNSLIEKIDFLNTESALLYCCNSEEFYIQILMTYLSEDKRDKLNRFYEQSDWENYKILVHGLKSTSRTIGADDLSEQARILEMAAKDSDESYIKSNHFQVMAQYTELLERIKILLNCGK